AEREVPGHPEERGMAGRPPDVLEVVVLAARAHALLRTGRSHIVPPLLAQKDALELHHAGVGEEQRRIARGDERRRRHARMPNALEVAEKRFPDLAARHRSVILTPRNRRAWSGSVVETEALTHHAKHDARGETAPQEVVAKPAGRTRGSHPAQERQSPASDA